MTIMVTGFDLTKNVFALHGVSETGTVQLRQPKARPRQAERAGGRFAAWRDWDGGVLGAHYWARQFQAHGHTVRLMAPKLVTL